MAKPDSGSQWKGEADVVTGVFKLSGEIDFTNTPMVRQWLAAQMSRLTADVQLDLQDVSYIDSSGLAILIEARKLLQGKGQTIRITAVSSQVQKLFSLTQIGDLFGI